MPPENTTSTTPPPAIQPEIEMAPAPKAPPILPIIIVVLLILIAVGGYYFYQKSVLTAKNSMATETVVSTLPPATPTGTPDISGSTDSATIQKEIDQTNLDSMDADFRQLDTSADQL